MNFLVNQLSLKVANDEIKISITTTNVNIVANLYDKSYILQADIKVV